MKTGFIFSLPRSGSTYTQRVLSLAPGVSTTAEPWLLPALFGIRAGEAPVAAFAYDHVRAALEELLPEIAEGETVWRRAIAGFAHEIYQAAAEPGAELFIDKTPRNHVFAREIMEAFPESPCLFLWRNPLAVVASINATWGGGRWKAYFYKYDLFDGLFALIDAWQATRGRSNVMAMRYEDLVAEPEVHWPRVFDHFGQQFDVSYLQNIPDIKGVMGDKTGVARYKNSSTASLDSWSSSFGSPVRQWWAKRYLEKIGEERLELMGYDYQELIEKLHRGSGPATWSDLFLMPAGHIYHFVEPALWRSRFTKKNASVRVARR